MSPGAHLLISWLSTPELFKNRRERVLVALSGLAPDIDGLGIVVDKITGTTNYYIEHHHYLGHSILAPFVFASIAAFFAKTQKLMVWWLVVVMVNIHVLFDVMGSRGPDGYQWPVYYLYPFNTEFQLTWAYQWELSAWQNNLIMLGLLSACGYYAVKKQFSFLEIFSQRLDQEAFSMYRKYILRQE